MGGRRQREQNFEYGLCCSAGMEVVGEEVNKVYV